MIPDDIVCHCLLHIAFDAVQMIEALISLGIHGILKYREQILEFLGNQNGIQHFSLGISRMNASPVDSDPAAGSIEGLILQFPQSPTVHSKGKIRTKERHIKVICPLSDLLVGGEGDPKLSVTDLGMGQQFLSHCHDLCNAGLVIRSQQGSTVGNDQVLSFELTKLREILRGHIDLQLLVQQNLSPVIPGYDAGLHVLTGDCRRGVQMSDQPEHGTVLTSF